MKKETLIAFVTLSGSEADGWQWVVECCPLCGEKHVHGGGPGDSDPRRCLGHRFAHCAEAELWAGYDLVEVVG